MDIQWEKARSVPSTCACLYRGVVRVNGYTVGEGQECAQHLCMSVQRSGEG